MELKDYLPYALLVLTVFIIYILLFKNNKKKSKIVLLKKENEEIWNENTKLKKEKEDSEKLQCINEKQTEINFFPKDIFKVLSCEQIEPKKFYITYVYDNDPNPDYFYYEKKVAIGKRFVFLQRHPTKEKFLEEIRS